MFKLFVMKKRRKLSLFLFFVQGTNDLVAYESSKVASLIEGLPVGEFAVGNNAYVNLNHLLVPFPGMVYLANADPRDEFNFYLSQL
jgi:hypothetical protein